MATTQAFCLRRSNHLNDMVDDLEKMFKDENMVDVSLSCEDGLIKAHKIILSACSSYFRQIFSKVNNPYQYPIIIIKDMSYADLKAIIDFIYKGEVTVPQEQLNSVLKSAEALKVKGLADVNNQKSQLISNKNPLENDSTGNQNRKKKKKRRKTNANLNNEEKKETLKNVNSSEDVSEYSEDDENLSHHQNSQNQQSIHQINHQHHILHSQSSQHLNSPVISAITTEGEIEPSRLLEQTMITGDAQNITNIQSISPNSNSNKYPQYLISSVKQMIYDDSSGLIASHLGSNETNTISSNHNLTLAQFDESSSINSLVGQSSISLLPRQSEGSTGVQNDSGGGNQAQQEKIQTPATTEAPSLKGNFQCTYCMKRFDVRYSLMRHLRVIHDPARHLFSCSRCGRRFAWKSAYLRHVNVTCVNRTEQGKTS